MLNVEEGKSSGPASTGVRIPMGTIRVMGMRT